MRKTILSLIIFCAILSQPGSALAQYEDSALEAAGIFTIPEAHADGTALGVGIIHPDGTFLYIGSQTSGRIWKIRVRDSSGNPVFQVEESVTVQGATNYSAAFMDPDGRYAYFTTDTAPGRVVRIRLSDFTIDTLVLTLGHDHIRSGIIDSDGSHLFLGTGTSPGRVIEIELIGFTVVNWMGLEQVEFDLRAAAYDPAGRQAFFATGTQVGGLVQINLQNFTRVRRIDFSNNSGPLRAMLYASRPVPAVLGGMWGAPGRILRFTATPFAQDSARTMNLPDGEFFIRAGARPSAGRYGYFMTGRAPYRVIQVDLEGPARVRALELAGQDFLPVSIAVDPSGNYLYTSVSVNTVRRIALTPSAKIAADNAEATPPAAGDASLPEVPGLPSGIAIHNLIKLADDGNPDTFGDSSVFYVGSDGKRYVFPGEKVFLTWYENFDQVKIVSAEAMAALALGGVVTYKPGVKMVKLQSSPRVYAVSRGGVLRAVSTEEVAADLYGADWNQKIDDIPDAFWTRYGTGDQINFSADFDSAAERDAALNISIDKSL